MPILVLLKEKCTLCVFLILSVTAVDFSIAGEIDVDRANALQSEHFRA